MHSQIIILKENKSDHHELVIYPDGQKNVILNLDKLNVKHPIIIKCRIKNIDELIVLQCLVLALRKSDFHVKAIQFIYLYGMRSDRSFYKTDINYFRDIIAPLINSLDIEHIKIFAPHNSIILDYANAFYLCEEIIPPLMIQKAYHIWGDESASFLTQSLSFFINPDSPSFKKTRLVNKVHSVSLENMKELHKIDIERIIILDDLCDGGGTFIAESEYLREQGFTGEINLFIAHGLFTKGIPALIPHFKHIYCTNSYQDIEHPAVTQFKVI